METVWLHTSDAMEIFDGIQKNLDAIVERLDVFEKKLVAITEALDGYNAQ